MVRSCCRRCTAGGAWPGSRWRAGRVLLIVVLGAWSVGAAAAPKDDLLAAAAAGDAERVEQALNQGAGVDSRDASGRTALMLAAMNGRLSVAALLLEAGAGVNVATSEGDTALMAATFRGHADVVKLLLEKGADPSRKNRDGVTALQLAEQKRFSQIARLLRGEGSSATIGSSSRFSVKCGPAEVEHSSHFVPRPGLGNVYTLKPYDYTLKPDDLRPRTFSFELSGTKGMYFDIDRGTGPNEIARLSERFIGLDETIDAFGPGDTKYTTYVQLDRLSGKYSEGHQWKGKDGELLSHRLTRKCERLDAYIEGGKPKF